MGWRQRFLAKKGFDDVLKMLFYFRLSVYADIDPVRDQHVYKLGMATLRKILHYFCKSCASSNIPKHVYMKKTRFISKDWETRIQGIEHNFLVSIVCMDSSVDRLSILDVIPSELSQLYTEPLISGYIKGCNIEKYIPSEILSLLLCFFC